MYRPTHAVTSVSVFWINIGSGSLNNRNYILMWMRTVKADAIQSVDVQVPVLAEYVVVVSEVGLAYMPAV